MNMERLEEEIGRLPDLPYRELKARWAQLFKTPAPKHIGRKLLEKAITYGLRDAAGGGLGAATKQALRRAAKAIANGDESLLSIGNRLPIGTRLARRWEGQTHIVEVTANGIEWNGSTFKSLSGVAKAITGSNWNGFVFFGVRRRPRRNKNARGPRRKALAVSQATGSTDMLEGVGRND